mmetsp:Transcript_13494/g.25397  ORF Transcript_13494/g.25397 Transcript_13494/m.25397 type:complete len:166 (+) Transcript_13494:414-911(+)
MALANSVNLLKNPYGSQGFASWTRFDNGCPGWAVETQGTLDENSHVFVCSYSWSSLLQSVPVDPSRTWQGTCYTYIARRNDCGAVAQLQVHIVNTYTGIQQIQTAEVVCPTDPGKGGYCKFVKLELKFKVPKGTIAIVVTIRGKDTQYWGGYFGARFGLTGLHLA